MGFRAPPGKKHLKCPPELYTVDPQAPPRGQGRHALRIGSGVDRLALNFRVTSLKYGLVVDWFSVGNEGIRYPIHYPCIYLCIYLSIYIYIYVCNHFKGICGALIPSFPAVQIRSLLCSKRDLNLIRGLYKSGSLFLGIIG